mmetsp:Transcript_56139/g.93564  ORF Transcript_56139/g.93564 Transcript_56139/m.93564 type:complete len:207 (+) Transcript_56139:510-1130(+)
MAITIATRASHALVICWRWASRSTRSLLRTLTVAIAETLRQSHAQNLFLPWAVHIIAMSMIIIARRSNIWTLVTRSIFHRQYCVVARATIGKVQYVSMLLSNNAITIAIARVTVNGVRLRLQYHIHDAHVVIRLTKNMFHARLIDNSSDTVVLHATTFDAVNAFENITSNNSSIHMHRRQRISMIGAFTVRTIAYEPHRGPREPVR